MRTHVILLSLLAAAAAIAASSDASQPPEPGKARPNIILCLTDDQGWGDVGYNGHPVLKTPNLDDMSRSGIRFDRFYAAHFNCSPTRASILSGRHPNRYRCFSWGHDLPLREITIAEAVKTKGYTTGHFGKWHVGGLPNAAGIMGFFLRLHSSQPVLICLT